MKFSIIIPHFNSLETLEELLKTIPQSDEVEVIIVDDNSNEHIYNELKNIVKKKRSVRLYRNFSNNKGAGACRNIGIKKAIGKWLLFADSDDLFTESAFFDINNYYMSDSNIIYFPPKSFSDINDLDSSRHVTFENLVKEYFKREDEASLLKLKYFFVVPWSKMHNRKFILDNNIYFSEVLLSNDLLFAARTASYAKEITCIDTVIYKVRLSRGSMTTNISKERYKLRFNEWINYVRFIKENTTEDEYKKLNITGLPKLLEIIRYRFGLKLFFFTIKELRRNEIRLIDRRIFSINFLASRIKLYRKKWKQERVFEK